MVWVKLDDGFLTNPKVMRVGLEGRALYVAGLCYCAGGLTDGLVPTGVLGKLGVLADVRKPVTAAGLLVGAGLWESVDGGYRVHDYLKYQPSAEDVRKERERVAEWRTKHRTEPVRNDVRNGSETTYGTASARDNAPARPGLTASEDAVPRRASAHEAPSPSAGGPGDDQVAPVPLPNGAKQCPMCPEVYTGSYGDHLATSDRHKIRPVPEDFKSKRHRRGEPWHEPVPPEVHAELEAMAQAKAQNGTVELSPDLAAEDARLRAAERSRKADPSA